jgi:hypothetical protein
MTACHEDNDISSNENGGVGAVGTSSTGRLILRLQVPDPSMKTIKETKGKTNKSKEPNKLKRNEGNRRAK